MRLHCPRRRSHRRGRVMPPGRCRPAFPSRPSCGRLVPLHPGPAAQQKEAKSVTDNPHRLAARAQFLLANQTATAAENATKDVALQNISKANTFYNAATGEMLLLILERIERL